VYVLTSTTTIKPFLSSDEEQEAAWGKDLASAQAAEMHAASQFSEMLDETRAQKRAQQRRGVQQQAACGTETKSAGTVAESGRVAVLGNGQPMRLPTVSTESGAGGAGGSSSGTISRVVGRAAVMGRGVLEGGTGGTPARAAAAFSQYEHHHNASEEQPAITATTVAGIATPYSPAAGGAAAGGATAGGVAAKAHNKDGETFF